MSKTNHAGYRNQDRAEGQHLIADLAGVIASCRSVRSGESVARELLGVGRSSQMFLGLVDNAERALVFDEAQLEVLEFPFGIDGLEQRPESRIEVATPRAEYVRSVIGEERLDWVHPRFRED
jgi:hypothetical protein